MIRVILFVFAISFLCGCAAPEQRDSLPVPQTSSAPESPSVRGKTAGAADRKIKATEKKQDSPRHSASGTFCGDKNVSDDF